MRAGRRVAIRVAAVGLGLAGLALTVPTFAATKDKQAGKQTTEKCCLVELGGLAHTVTAGGAPARFDLVLSRSAKGCTQTRRTIAVRLDGVAAEHLRIERLVSGQALVLRDTSSEAGTVEAVDPLVDSKLICGAETTVEASYRIAFLDGTPPGPAELVVAAHTVSGKLLDSATATTAVVVEAVSTTAPPPPPETTPPVPPVTEGPAEETTAPPSEEAPAPPPETSAAAPPAVARPPLERTSETSPLSTTLLTASIVLALSAMLLLGVLWRLRRGSTPVPAADDAATVALPPGVGAELARLTEDGDAARPPGPAAP